MKNTAGYRVPNESPIEELGRDDFNYLRSAIFSLAGISLNDSKKLLLQTRLRSRLQAFDLSGFSEYCSILKHLPPDHPEWQVFTNCLTTNKTDWFREPEHFDFLINRFVPHFSQQAKERTTKKPLSVWSAACSTGEEPYTIAMLLKGAGERGELGPYEIVATDIDTEVLVKAQKGIYQKSSLQQLPQKYQKSAFIPGTEGISHLMRVRPELKDFISFRRLNLMQSPYPWSGQFDIIFCRNVFIYFTKEVIATVLDSMYRAAAKDAVLFIGHSESITGLSKWQYLEPSVYVKGKIT